MSVWPEADSVTVHLAGSDVQLTATTGITMTVPLSKARTLLPSDLFAKVQKVYDSASNVFAANAKPDADATAASTDRVDAAPTIHIIDNQCDDAADAAPTIHIIDDQCDDAAETRAPPSEVIEVDDTPSQPDNANENAVEARQTLLDIMPGRIPFAAFPISPYDDKPQLIVEYVMCRTEGTHTAFTPSTTCAVGKRLDLTSHQIGSAVHQIISPDTTLVDFWLEYAAAWAAMTYIVENIIEPSAMEAVIKHLSTPPERLNADNEWRRCTTCLEYIMIPTIEAMERGRKTPWITCDRCLKSTVGLGVATVRHLLDQSLSSDDLSLLLSPTRAELTSAQRATALQQYNKMTPLQKQVLDTMMKFSAPPFLTDSWPAHCQPRLLCSKCFAGFMKTVVVVDGSRFPSFTWCASCGSSASLSTQLVTKAHWPTDVLCQGPTDFRRRPRYLGKSANRSHGDEPYGTGYDESQAW